MRLEEEGDNARRRYRRVAYSPGYRSLLYSPVYGTVAAEHARIAAVLVKLSADTAAFEQKVHSVAEADRHQADGGGELQRRLATVELREKSERGDVCRRPGQQERESRSRRDPLEDQDSGERSGTGSADVDYRREKNAVFRASDVLSAIYINI